MKIKIFTKFKNTIVNFMNGKPSEQPDQTDFNKFYKNLSGERSKLNSRIFDLIIGRVLKRVYSGLNEDGKKNMERVFLSDSDKEKGEFIKKYITDFKKIFNEEAEKIDKEIAEAMLKQQAA